MKKNTGSRTASTARVTRTVADSVRRRSALRPPPFEIWGTIAPRDRNRLANGTEWPSVCLWGEQESAMSGRDPDERVCLVRVEVLEVLDDDELLL